MNTLNNTFDYTTEDLDDMSQAINYNQWIISLIRPYIGNSVLEVGAGSGSFTQALLDHTDLKQITAIEPASTQYKKLFEKFKSNDIVKTFNGFLIDIDTNIKFNTIIYNNVLEHIENDIEELKEAKSKLKEGGIIIIYSPALPLLMSDFDKKIGHFHRYTKKSIKTKIEIANLETVKLQYVDFIGVFLWFIKFKLLKSMKIGGANVKLFDKIIVPIQSKVESLVTLPFGKNILAIIKMK